MIQIWKNRQKNNRMEKKFLHYLLYAALIDLRYRANENNDKASFWLCDLLHNIPLNLNTDEDIERAYIRLCEKIEFGGKQDWLNIRKEEFYNRYPEYKMSS